MTQEEFNAMLAVGIAQGLPGSYYTSRYKNGEEIDRRLGNAAVPAVGDNILINADFRNPVNRNGKTEYSGDTYTIDCWKTYIGVVAVTDNGITLRENAIFTQIIQDRILRSLNGKTLTGSVLSADGTLYVGTGVYTYGETLILLNVGTPIHSQMYIEANVHGFQFYDHSKDVELVAAKLELGSTQTLAQKDTSGNWGLIDPPNYALQYALCSQYSPATGAWVGSQHSNPNLLDNWYFLDPVNQRGENVYSNDGWNTLHSIDRWYLSCAAWDVSAHKLTTTVAYGRIAQKLDGKALVGKTVTFSALVSSVEGGDLHLYFGPGDIGPVVMAAGSSGLISFTITMHDPGQKTNDVFITLNAAGASAVIDAVKLELGAQQTLAHQDADGNWVLNDPPPNKALELAKCQRYFVQLNYEPNETIGLSYEGSAWTAMQLSLPTEMRHKHPALSFTCSPTIYGGVAISKFDNVTAAGSVMQIGVSRTGANVASYFYAGTAGYLRLDADL